MKHNTKIKKQFFEALKCGIGRAYFIQKENPEIDFSKEIIKGSLLNFAYDRQCEGSRAVYINKIIRKSKNSEYIEKEVLKRLTNKEDVEIDMEQICDLAILFYKSGNKNAKSILEKRFSMNSYIDTEFSGQEQLMEIAGVEGVLTVAKLVGKYLVLNDDKCEDSWNVDEFQKKNKQINIFNILKEEAKKNKFIEKYLRTILANKLQPYRRKKSKPYTYALIKKRFEERRRFFHISEGRAKEIPENDVKKLAEDFLKEDEKRMIENYLRFFSKRKYPNDPEPLFKIASKRNPPKTRILEFALQSLKFFKSEKIREFAIQKIKSTRNPYCFLPLLVSNYRKGDSELLMNVLERSKSQDFIHSNIDEIIEIYERNKTKECKEPLEKIYRSMTCGLHRTDILQILWDNNVLEESILQEMKFDSEEGNRKLYRKIMKNRRQQSIADQRCPDLLDFMASS